MASTTTAGPTCNLKPDSRFIDQGDLVLLWLSRDKDPVALTVESGREDSNPFGTFSHDDMIGRPWGSRLYAKNRRGYVFLLKPTPSLWTLSLPHRTQILYYPDICFISLKLNLGPGSRLIEAGTGSGSFTHWSSNLVGRVDQWPQQENRDANGNQLVREQNWQGRFESLKRNWNWKGLKRENDITRPIRGLKMTKEQKEWLKNGDASANVNGNDNQVSNSSSTVNRDSNSTADSSPHDQFKERVEGSKDKEREDREEEEGIGEREKLGNSPIQFNQLSETDGKVWSFEFHKLRKEKAQSEFQAHGLLDSIVTLSHRDVCKSGFGLSPDLASTSTSTSPPTTSTTTTTSTTAKSTSSSAPLADAIFLDVPAPWEAIPHTLQALRPEITTRICCFSPCMEQVLKTVEALRKNGFDKIETFECLQKGYESHTWFQQSDVEVQNAKGKKRKIDDVDDDDDERENGEEEAEAEQDEENQEQDGEEDGDIEDQDQEQRKKSKPEDSNPSSSFSSSSSLPNPNLENAPISSAILKIREIELKKKNRRLKQIENARIERERKNREKLERRQKEEERRRIEKEKRNKEEEEETKAKELSEGLKVGDGDPNGRAKTELDSNDQEGESKKMKIHKSSQGEEMKEEKDKGKNIDAMEIEIDSTPSHSKTPNLQPEKASSPTKRPAPSNQPKPKTQEIDLSSLTADPDFPTPPPIVASGRRDVHKSHLKPANVWAKVLPEMRGHTSYLTFAVLLPRTVV